MGFRWGPACRDLQGPCKPGAAWGPLIIQASGPNSRQTGWRPCWLPGSMWVLPAASSPAPSRLVLPMVFTGTQAQLGPVPCPVPSHSPPPRTPLAPVAAHGPTCCSPFPGTRWVFSRHHPGAWACVPVALCHLPAVCDQHLDLHAHWPTWGMVQGPWGPQPRAEWRCPE